LSPMPAQPSPHSNRCCCCCTIWCYCRRT
jgi:hypothetical protein